MTDERTYSGILLEECEEYLYEMASIYTRDTHMHKIMGAVNPSEERVGECYFKIYDANTYGKAKHVVRLDFFKPRMLKHTKSTKKHWSHINKQDLKAVNDFLDSETNEYPGVTVFDALKYRWNLEKGFQLGPIQEYLNGTYDDNYIDDPNYVPSVLESPDYSLTQIIR